MTPRYNLLPTHPLRPERAALVHELTQAAFAPYASLPRPSGALAETVDDVAADLDAGGALLAYDERWEAPLGALRWRCEGDHLWVKRVSVHPDHQGRGVGDFLMDACRGVAIGFDLPEIRLGVRHQLERNRHWYERRGFRAAREHDDWTEYAAPVEPFVLRAPVRFVKLEYPDRLQGVNRVDLIEETGAGTWVAAPRFTPTFQGDRLVWVQPSPVVGFLPRDRWWAAWWSDTRLSLKVDICTPPRRTAEGDLTFQDLSLDVVIDGDAPALVVDEDEFAEAAYAPEIATAATEAAAEVLTMIREGTEPFGTEGRARLAALASADPSSNRHEA